MRRIGLVIMIAGIIALLLAVTLAEIASAPAKIYLDVAFYAGAAMALAGSVLITVRVMWARRGS